jgi:broad specificity phosphatase PhoE
MVGETRWWWIRHAPVPDGGRIYGQRDLDCDCSAQDVFSALVDVLPRDAVWLTSGLKRTHQTAAAIRAAAAELAAAPDPVMVEAFAEQHLGDWQGLVRRDFLAERRAAGHQFWFAAADECAPGGESFADLVARVTGAIDRLNDEHSGRNIIAVAHGGTIRAALAHALDISADAALAFTIDNCSLTRLDHLGAGSGPKWRIGAVNQRYGAARTGHMDRTASAA